MKSRNTNATSQLNNETAANGITPTPYTQLLNRQSSIVNRQSLVVLGLYALLTLIFTWPLALHFRESVPGEAGKDAWQMVWNLWWVRYALEHGQNPLQTDLLFYPQGADLYLHALNLWNGSVSLPVQYLVGGAAQGAVAGYNFIVWLSLTLAGFGAYQLALYLWDDWRAALIAGLAYGFSTYQFAHLLGHLNLVSSEFIPFYILYFLKALRQREKWRGAAGLAVLFLIFSTFLELQYVLYLAIFSLLYLLYLTGSSFFKRRVAPYQSAANPSAIVNRQSLIVNYWLKASLIAAAFLLVTLPFSLAALNQALTNPNTIPLRQEKIYSADLLVYFYPSPFHPLWGDALTQAIKPFTATLIEKVVFPGFTVYLLLIIGLLSLKSKVRIHESEVRSQNIEDRPPSPFFWGLTALSFAVLSFGPVLHINGKEWGPPLPGALIYELPLLNITRVPSRFAVIALLALGVLAAWGLARVGQRIGRDWRYNLVVGVAFAALAFELLPAPYLTTEYKVAQFYKNLASDPTSYAIFDVPVRQYETAYMQAQMEHQKPLLGGYISRNPVYPPYYGVPIFQQFRSFETAPKPDFLPNQALSPAILSYFGVRYVVVHRDLMSENETNKVLSLGYKLFPAGAVYEAENLVVFEVLPQDTSGLFFANPVLTGWYEAEKGEDGGYSRWVQGSEAKIDFWSAKARTLNLEFPVWSFNEPHSLELSLVQGNNEKQRLEQRQVGTDLQAVKLQLELKPGRNQLVFKIDGKATRPADIAPGNDTRSLTIAVGTIKIGL